MRSIRWKILRATLYWLFIIITILTVISIFVVSKISKKASEELLTQVCEKETFRFNNEFKLLENSVATIASYVHNQEEVCEKEKEMLSDEFCDKVLEMTLSIANRTEGAMAVYFRYNPELTGNGTQGFFWSRESDQEQFSYFEPTDILKYDQNDIEHVGWFYEPKKKEEAMWMSPYYNKNLNVFMISYVIPYYTEEGIFLGVIGMDIDFNKIVQLAKGVSIYESGKIDLVDLSTYLIYEAGGDDAIKKSDLSVALYNHITTIDKEKETLTLIGEDGEAYVTCVSQLQNGLRLMLFVTVDEVEEQRNHMMGIIAVIMTIVLSCSVIYIVKLTNKMVCPIRRLTEITGKYAKGDWGDTFISETEDEIQELSESISIMAETTRSYIDRINENAMTDSLTGLKNKNCYLAYIERFKAENDIEGTEYAVIVFDINYLKKANDRYGHEMGDRLIKLAGEYICGIFVHSPVFRIGGDEYCAILEKEDYREKERLSKEFEEGMKKLPPIIGDIWLSISYGIACRKEDGENYDEIFKNADERMYAYKKRIKAGRE